MYILFVEDNPRPMGLADLLEEQNHNVTRCFTLCDAEEHLSNKSTKPFDVIFLDLTINPRDLPPVNREEAVKCELAGWVFHKYVVKELAPTLLDRTIFYTAYANKLQRQISPEEFERLLILPKNSEKLLEKALELIEKVSQ